MLTYDIADVRVRYADTDQMGVVYYGNYARFFELARVELLRHLGINYTDIEATGTGMAVVDMHSRYHRPARFDDLLTIRISVPEMPTSRMTFTYEIFNQHNTLIHTGSTTLVFVSLSTFRPTAAPALMLNVLKPFFE